MVTADAGVGVIESLAPRLRVYISGPMTGYDDFNYPAFEEAVRLVKRLGHIPVSPHTQEVEEGKAWESYMRTDIAWMMECDIVVVLPGWEDSRGAQLETYIAKQLGMPVYEIDMFEANGGDVPGGP